MAGDFTVYAICREPECSYVWTRPPEVGDTCPKCGTSELPMGIMEAEALRKSRLSRENLRRKRWSNVLYDGADCPSKCDGTLAYMLPAGREQSSQRYKCNTCEREYQLQRVHPMLVDRGPANVTIDGQHVEVTWAANDEWRNDDAR